MPQVAERQKPKRATTERRTHRLIGSKTPMATGTLGKALAVLDIIAQAPVPLRFTDVLRQSDQPRGTLHRQISHLVEEGLVTVNADHSYTPGIRLLKLAARAWSQNSIRSIAEPHIRALHEHTGETVHLGILNDLEVIYVDKIESRQSVRMHSQVGNASPLYCTGIGKAMLAVLPPQEASARAQRFSYRQHTPTTLASPALLLAELEIIRSTGISHDREEHEPGIRCVAASICSATEEQVAGISVTAPAYRTSKETIAEWEQLVPATAKAIEADLNDQIGPRAGQ